MNHENSLRETFRNYKILGFLNSMQDYWEPIAFVNAIINNCLILLYYDKTFDDVYQFSSGRKTALFCFGVSLTIICLIMMFLHFLKRYAIITKYAKRKFIDNSFGLSGCKKFQVMLTYYWESFVSLISDFETLYYFSYLIFALLGITISMSFLIWHLVKLLRYDLLKNVVTAIFNKASPMLLSFMLFWLIEYYYTILGYSFYYDQYPNQRCLTLWECFLTNFDLTFKEGGGTGAL